MPKRSSKKQSSKFVFTPVLLVILLLGAVFFLLRSVNQPEEQSLEEQEPIEHQQVRVFEPQPEELVSFPFMIKGEAIPEWFEEGRFPIRILSEVGTVLVDDIAEATGEVSQDGFIPFEATIEEFDIDQWEYGTVVLSKNNPFQFTIKDQHIFPISFK